MYVRVSVCSKWKKNDKIKRREYLSMNIDSEGMPRAMPSCYIFYFLDPSTETPWMCSVCKRYTYNTCAFLKVYYNNFNKQFAAQEKETENTTGS